MHSQVDSVLAYLLCTCDYIAKYC